MRTYTNSHQSEISNEQNKMEHNKKIIEIFYYNSLDIGEFIFSLRLIILLLLYR